RDTLLLLDSPKVRTQLKDFLQSYQPHRVVPVGAFSEEAPALEQRLAYKITPMIPWSKGPPTDFWKEYCPRAERVVVCTVEPRRQFLQAGCLAGACGAPLFLLSGHPEERLTLRKRLSDWKTRKIYAIGDAVTSCHDLKNVQVIRLLDEESVAQTHRRF